MTLSGAVDQLVLSLEHAEAELRVLFHRLSDEFSRRPFGASVSLFEASPAACHTC